MFSRRKGPVATVIRQAARDRYGNLGAVVVDALHELFTGVSPTCPTCRIRVNRVGADTYVCTSCRQIFKAVTVYDEVNTDNTDGSELPFARDFAAERQRRQRARAAYNRRQDRRSSAINADADLRVLGLQQGATTEQIRKRRKELARKFHGDLHGGNNERMKVINAAADRLLKRARRAKG